MNEEPMAPAFELHRTHLGLLRTAALDAVDPAAAVRRAISPNDYADADRIFVVGAGKAGVAMACAVSDLMGTRLTAGVVSVPRVPPCTPESVTFIAGGHPIPTDGSLSAGRAVADLLAQTTVRDLVIVLVSGGGSALLELPRPGLSLTDLRLTTNALLRCGAAIDEINRIRVPLSLLKGGGLIRLAYPARVLGLIISDVVGNRLDAIASGPTVFSPRSETDAGEILEKYNLHHTLPTRVVEYLTKKKADETDTPLSAADNRCIACNRCAGEAAAAASAALGFNAAFVADDWQGEAREVGRRFAGLIAEKKGKGPQCLIVGGESTVTLRGNGKGGRNQEAALAAAMAIEGRPNCVISAFATDGIDGPTTAAGAVVTGDTIARASSLGLDPQRHLDDNNTYPFFDRLGDLIITGHTGTNVNDLLFGLLY